VGKTQVGPIRAPQAHNVTGGTKKNRSRPTREMGAGKEAKGADETCKKQVGLKRIGL
jgi:hypothetical protein